MIKFIGKFYPAATRPSHTDPTAGATLIAGVGTHTPPAGSAPIPDRGLDPAGPAFTDVSAAAGIVHHHEKPVLDAKLANIMPWMTSVGAAVAAGDYDNDGRIDLYVTSSRKGRPNFLYRNNGDGTFTDVAAVAGLADVNGATLDLVGEETQVRIGEHSYDSHEGRVFYVGGTVSDCRVEQLDIPLRPFRSEAVLRFLQHTSKDEARRIARHPRVRSQDRIRRH